jgi:histidinol-phosphate aminotransferase
VERLAAGLPAQAILVLDGAYAEFVEGYDGGAGLVERRDNVVMTRTFSKIYGLGGLRVGWGYGPKEIIDVLNRIRGPFNLSNTQLDVAEAAVRDQDYVNRCRSENARMRNWLALALGELGVPSDTSMANFILARFASPEEAEACDLFLQGQGLIVRRVTSYKLPHCLRITIGDESSCRRIAHAIAQFKGMR